MKKFQIVILTLVVTVIAVGGAVAQQEKDPPGVADTPDAPFPDVVECARKILPAVVTDNTVTQTAVYTPTRPSRTGCATIEFKFSKGVKKTADVYEEDMFFHKLKFGRYEAWQATAMCGTPPCSQRLQIFLDEDIVVILDEDCASNVLFKALESSDLQMLERYIDQLANSIAARD